VSEALTWSIHEPVSASHNDIHSNIFQNRHRLSIVSSENCWSQEIVMASSCKRPPISHFAFAVSSTAALLSANAAFASQGPGGGPGTASGVTQMAMAIIVYGASALVVGAGLIGATRRRWR
jgi:hypothetical protein